MDVPQTNPLTGEWLASDGKWYPAHLHHDPQYRARYRPSLEPPTAPARREPEKPGPPATWPEPVAGTLPVLGRSNLLPALFAIAGVVLGIVGVFLSWVDVGGVARGSVTGWDLDPDGQIVLVTMMLIAFAAGAMAAGYQHLAIKVACLVSAVVVVLMAVLKMLDINTVEADNLGYSLDIGVGLFMLLGSGICLLGAALFEHSPWDFRPGE